MNSKKNCYLTTVYLPYALPSRRHRMTSTPPRHVIWESEGLVAYLHPRPWTPGSVILERSTTGSLGGSIFHLEKQEFLSWLLGARGVAELLCDRLAVRRCALVSRPHRDRPTQVRGFLDQWIDWLAVQYNQYTESVSLLKFSLLVQTFVLLHV